MSAEVGVNWRALADELAAFANAGGGLCVLGVQDGTREVLGFPVEARDEVERRLHEACEKYGKHRVCANI